MPTFSTFVGHFWPATNTCLVFNRNWKHVTPLFTKSVPSFECAITTIRLEQLVKLSLFQTEAIWSAICKLSEMIQSFTTSQKKYQMDYQMVQFQQKKQPERKVSQLPPARRPSAWRLPTRWSSALRRRGFRWRPRCPATWVGGKSYENLSFNSDQNIHDVFFGKMMKHVETQRPSQVGLLFISFYILRLWFISWGSNVSGTNCWAAWVPSRVGTPRARRWAPPTAWLGSSWPYWHGMSGILLQELSLEVIQWNASHGFLPLSQRTNRWSNESWSGFCATKMS